MELANTPVPKILEGQFIVLVGLMGAGKTNLGQRIALAIDLPFIDTDTEIEKAAGCTIGEFFERFGEKEFRKRNSSVLVL